jgi:transposase InsO family protein
MSSTPLGELRQDPAFPDRRNLLDKKTYLFRESLIHDRDAKYGTELPAATRSLKINAVRTSFASPWQNAVAERWVGSCRSELLDHVIVLNERHLKRLLSEYVSYYHEDHTHLGLEKETPRHRPHCATHGRVLSYDRLGGLHHRYDRAA